MSGLPASATTQNSILDNTIAIVEALVPTVHPGKQFHRGRVAGRGHSGDFRLFSLAGSTESEDLGVNDPSCHMVREHLTLKVFYPVLPTLYAHSSSGPQSDREAMEYLINTDRTQLRDRLTSGRFYLPGQVQCKVTVAPLAELVTVEAKPGTPEQYAILMLDLAVTYYCQQTL